MSIGTRLFLIALVGLVLLGAQSFVSLQSKSAQLRREAQDQAQLLAHLAAGEMRDTLAPSGSFFDDDISTPAQLCALVAPFGGQFSAVVTDLSGTVACEIGDEGATDVLTNPDEVVTISSAHELARAGSDWEIVAVLSLDFGAVRYVVDASAVEPTGLVERRSDVEVVLVADDRAVGVWPDAGLSIGTPLSMTPLPRDVLVGATEGRGVANTPRTFASSPVGSGEWTVIVGIDHAVVSDAIAGARRDALLTVAGGAVVLLGLVLVFSRNIATPIRSMATSLRSSAGSDLPELVEQGPAEVRELARRFNEMREQAIESTAQLAHLAHHDPLTGLFNRHQVVNELERTLATIAEDEAVVLLHLDVDDFGAVNQSYGTDVGDAVLVELARRLRSLTDEGIHVGRLGGDEFVVFRVARATTSRKFARRVLAAMQQPAVAAGITIETAATIGATVALPNATSESALREAAHALEEAKSSGADLVVHDEDLRSRHVERARIANDLRVALDSGDVLVAFQPILSCVDGRVTSVEALARWTHPELGAISPEVFIGIAERHGLVNELGSSVLRRACHVAAGWHRDHPAIAPSVSVNVSPRQLGARDFPEVVAGVLRETGLPADGLTLEVTESLLLDDLVTMCDRLRLIRGLGVHVAIDDFGTGYSSLSYLTSLPVDSLKIDRSFIIDLETDVRVQAVLASIVDLGHSSGLSVICEGVESEGQQRIVTELGADLVQGYLHMRPDVAHDEVLAYVVRAAQRAEAVPGRHPDEVAL